MKFWGEPPVWTPLKKNGFSQFQGPPTLNCESCSHCALKLILSFQSGIRSKEAGIFKSTNIELFGFNLIKDDLFGMQTLFYNVFFHQ